MATFGNTSPGSTLYDGFNDWTVAEKFQATEAGTVTSLWAYLDNTYTSHVACHAKMALCSLSGSNWTLCGQSAEVDIADGLTWRWVEFQLQTPVVVTPGYYLLKLMGDTNAVALCSHYDGVAGLGNERGSTTYAAGFDTDDVFGIRGYEKFPFYATYTPASTGIVTDVSMGLFASAVALAVVLMILSFTTNYAMTLIQQAGTRSHR